MKLIVLQFSSLPDLMDFEMNIESSGHIIDHAEINISGLFSDSEVRLAMQRYKVSVSETVI
jgi:hypothetical protein